jgi:hypothetical protein
MKTNFILCLVLFAMQISYAQDEHKIIFHLGQTQLSDKHKVQLRKIVTDLKDEHSLTIYPLTYDYINRAHFFSNLSDQQSKEIIAYLGGFGLKLLIKKVEIQTEYKGNPVGLVFKRGNTQPSPVDVSTQFPANKDQYITVAEKFEEKASEFFTIWPQKDTVLHAKDGTVLSLLANSLMCEDSVVLELKEYYKLGDYLKDNLMTVSNDELIETGGTIYLDAFNKMNPNETVYINPAIGIGVNFASDKMEMSVFLPESNINPINWLTPSDIISQGTYYAMEVQYDYLGDTMSKKIFDSEEELQAYQEWKEQKIKRQKEKAERIAREQKLIDEKRNNSMFHIYNLGYINCDRFLENETQPLVLKSPVIPQIECFLVIEGIGVLKGRTKGDQIRFLKVPMNKTATLIALSFTHDKSYYYKSTYKAGDEEPNIQMRPVKDEFIQEQLSIL